MLTDLNIRGNRIGPEGAKAIAAALGSSVLTDLNLRGNSIGMEGAKALAGALASGAVLKMKKCDLSFNGLHAEGKSALQEAVKGEEGFRMLV